MRSAYQFPAVCDYCGEEGVTNFEGNATQWTEGGELVCVDEQACRERMRLKIQNFETKERSQNG